MSFNLGQVHWYCDKHDKLNWHIMSKLPSSMYSSCWHRACIYADPFSDIYLLKATFFGIHSAMSFDARCEIVFRMISDIINKRRQSHQSHGMQCATSCQLDPYVHRGQRHSDISSEILIESWHKLTYQMVLWDLWDSATGCGASELHSRRRINQTWRLDTRDIMRWASLRPKVQISHEFKWVHISEDPLRCCRCMQMWCIVLYLSDSIC